MMAELMAAWGLLLLASSQNRNETKPLLERKINFSQPAKIIRERERRGSKRVGPPSPTYWSLTDTPSSPLGSLQGTEVHSVIVSVASFEKCG